jgi:hypothetical protein
MLVLVWIALGIALVACAGGAAVATRRGLGAFRLLKATSGELTARADQVARDADVLATKLEGLADDTGRLDHALARLHESRARLNVLLHAIGDVRATIARFTGVVPRKG